MDTIIDFFKGLDFNTIATIASIAIIWIFVKGIRWIINIGIVFFLAVYFIWSIPTVNHFLSSLLN